MLEREADETTRGGILADAPWMREASIPCQFQSEAQEMGMGKTLQAIALILAGATARMLF